jgi:hypothetical protein
VVSENFEDLLTGGHPNSLGRTVEVVEVVLADTSRFDELFTCYRSADEVVRLRVSSAMKRIAEQRRDLLIPYVDRFTSEIGALDQASAQWTLAILFDHLKRDLTSAQHNDALTIMKRNLEHHDDWIVLNTTMEKLFIWSVQDEQLAGWLRPQLERLASDPRKSVSKRATKFLSKLTAK